VANLSSGVETSKKSRQRQSPHILKNIFLLVLRRELLLVLRSQKGGGGGGSEPIAPKVTVGKQEYGGYGAWQYGGYGAWQYGGYRAWQLAEFLLPSLFSPSWWYRVALLPRW
jgi:hypothetical protein